MATDYESLRGYGEGALSWNADKTSVKLTKKFDGAAHWFLGGDFPSLVTIDARQAETGVGIQGNSGNNVIYASNNGGWIQAGKGNDKIYLGAGIDQVYWGINSNTGNDIVYNFDSKKDALMCGFGPLSHLTYTVSGSDIVVTNKNTKETLTLKNTNIADTTAYLDKRGVEYKEQKPSMLSWTADNKGVTITPEYTSSSFDGAQYSTLAKIDASANKNSMTIKGNALANTIKASTGGSTIRLVRATIQFMLGQVLTLFNTLAVMEQIPSIISVHQIKLNLLVTV